MKSRRMGCGPGRLLIALAALGWLSGCGSGDSMPRPGRIILVSMDTVRADAVGLGGRPDATPEIARIAREGVSFRSFVAASNYTLPSHMTMFTGLDPAEHGVYRGVARVSPQVTLLAESLADAGYLTQAFHEGGYVAPRFGFDRGFEEYRGFDPLELIREKSEQVFGWMRAAGERPYFLFLHTYQAHAPYGGYARYRSESPQRNLLTPARIAALRQRFADSSPDRSALSPSLRAACTLYNLLAESWRDVLGCGDESYAAHVGSPHFAEDLAAMQAGYARRIVEIDGFIGNLRATLEALGQWDDTLLIITADHGEAFFEQRGQLHDYQPWHEVLWIPLVLSYPERFERVAGRRVNGLAGHADLMPTLLSLAGVASATQGRGLDLTAVALGERELPADRAQFPAILRSAHLPQKPLRRVALRGSLQYIEGAEEFGDAEGLLLEVGPGHQTNRRAERPGDVAELRAAIARYREGLVPVAPLDFRTGEEWEQGAPAPGHELDEQERELLRGLGYLR